MISHRVLTRMLNPENGWIVISHFNWGGERNTFYNGVETSPRVLKILRVNSRGKVENRQYLLADICTLLFGFETKLPLVLVGDLAAWLVLPSASVIWI